MKKTRNSYPVSEAATRKQLAARLRGQACAIEKALYDHVSTLCAVDEREKDDPEYCEGRRAVITELVKCVLICLEQPTDQPAPPVPLTAAMQARRAARKGIALGTIIRRYVAGEKLLAKVIMDEGSGLPISDLWNILAAQAPRFDALLEAVISEYTDEIDRIECFPQMRLKKYVDGLLAGHSFAQTPDLGYDLEAWHLGVILTGMHPEETVQSLATAVGRRALVVPHDEGVTWAWLGGATELPIANVERAVHASMPEDVSVAIGEPRRGIDGWRVTHREALAGLQVMLRKPQRVIRGSGVILLAAVLRDDGLSEALRQTYIVPLSDDGGGEQGLHETLRAYFSTGGNAVTSAALLGVNRQTVQRRIRKIEERLGCLLPTCQAELEVALSLEQLYCAAGDEGGCPGGKDNFQARINTNMKHVGSRGAAN